MKKVVVKVSEIFPAAKSKGVVISNKEVLRSFLLSIHPRH